MKRNVLSFVGACNAVCWARGYNAGSCVTAPGYLDSVTCDNGRSCHCSGSLFGSNRENYYCRDSKGNLFHC